MSIPVSSSYGIAYTRLDYNSPKKFWISPTKSSGTSIENCGVGTPPLQGSERKRRLSFLTPAKLDIYGIFSAWTER